MPRIDADIPTEACHICNETIDFETQEGGSCACTRETTRDANQ